MKLKKLIKDIDLKVIKGSKEIEITGITNNSKNIAPGYLFVAKRGKVFDGNEYITDAIMAGASCVLTDFYNPFLENFVQLITENVAEIEPLLAKRFYNDPSKDLFLVGVTGTNGKTISSYLLKSIFEHFGPTGLMGTIETIIGDCHYESSLTTPDVITCNKFLREMVLNEVKSAFMEVSSHALSQKRIDGLLYDTILFTNLSNEHLDYHKTMEEYAKEKAKLCEYLKPNGTIVYNVDDPWCEKMTFNSSQTKITFGIKEKADYYPKNIHYSLTNTKFTLCSEEGEIEMESPLLGEFNLYNVLGVIAIAKARGVSLEIIRDSLKNFQGVNGRMETISLENGNTIIVDFAHTEDALEKVLSVLKNVTKGKLYTVFGCGGKRDLEKRPKMASVAEKYSDFVIVTSDNPRSESLDKINDEICKGFLTNDYLVEADRKTAIAKGIDMLKSTDILLIAGKGHEKKQIFAHKMIDFDDVKVAKEILNVLI